MLNPPALRKRDLAVPKMMQLPAIRSERAASPLAAPASSRTEPSVPAGAVECDREPESGQGADDGEDEDGGCVEAAAGEVASPGSREGGWLGWVGHVALA